MSDLSPYMRKRPLSAKIRAARMSPASRPTGRNGSIMAQPHAATVSVPVEILRDLSESLKLVARSADVNRDLIAELLGEELPVDISTLAEQIQQPASPSPSGVADFASYRARRQAVSA